ncbi:30S ribosomal protein S9 [Candidatus Peregrinibacteria bacterium CG11_big_fil_rev_8_21_14_0_20_46_8]|nr:MAG: 30S ribosomal protein S9 [Candidatus Peregrinibacteria bacterium CG11_big_fil_rev_8_21_14_0_20_46_8]
MPAKKTTTSAKTSPAKKTAPKKAPAKKSSAKSTSKSSPKVAQEAQTKKTSTAPKVDTPKAKVAPVAVAAPKGDYFYANGKRKSAVARVRLYPKGKGNIIVNNKALEQYFTVLSDQDKIHSPLRLTDNLTAFDITVIVKGGGIPAQADAIRHGIAKALVTYKAELRPALKHAMFLRRDSRVKERKKFGLKRARRAPQWSKR